MGLVFQTLCVVDMFFWVMSFGSLVLDYVFYISLLLVLFRILRFVSRFFEDNF